MMKYTMHKDIPNNKWNVFEVLNGHEIFLRAFDTVDEARQFCESGGE